MSETPDKAVAQQIVTELGEQKLLAQEKLAKLAAKLASGVVSSQDWRLLAELELQPRKEDRDANADSH